MGRLPFEPSKFDPSRMAGPSRADAASSPAKGADHITVSQLAGLVDRAVRESTPAGVKVVGEIGQARERTHHYFDLKDEGACVSCVMWASSAKRSGYVPKTGDKVVCTGRVEFYAPQGKTQFMVDKIEPVGAGALDLAFRRLCDELRGLGWFAPERKRELPAMPRRVAVVTSRSGAALQDVIDTVWRRCPSVELCLVDVRVQGSGAAEQVARAITRLGKLHAQLGIDVILVTRGGGSMEDLWAFNERIVAQAIVECPIPVVAAIGHETDTTIAELVADVRGATPTQAAMRIVPDASDLRRQVTTLAQRMTAALKRQLRLDEERLRSAARHPALSSPESIVQALQQRLERLSGELKHAARWRARAAGDRLDGVERRLDAHRPAEVFRRREQRLAIVQERLRAAMSCRVQVAEERSAAASRALELVGPRSVLARGYSMTTRESGGELVRATGDVSPGETIRTHVADGSFTSVVGGGRADEQGAHPLPGATKATSRKPPGGKRVDVGPSLFDAVHSDTPSRP